MLASTAAAEGSHSESRSTKHQDMEFAFLLLLSLAKCYKSASLNQLPKGGHFTGTLTSALKQSPSVEYTGNSNNQYFLRNL